MLKIEKEDKSQLKGLKYIDLFAGIGGFRYALDSFECKCVFTSEWDKTCQKNYYDNFKELPAGDITKINEKDMHIYPGGFHEPHNDIDHQTVLQDLENWCNKYI